MNAIDAPKMEVIATITFQLLHLQAVLGGDVALFASAL
jgi:hypothetical protein